MAKLPENSDNLINKQVWMQKFRNQISINTSGKNFQCNFVTLEPFHGILVLIAYGSSEGSGESVLMHRLARAFIATTRKAVM